MSFLERYEAGEHLAVWNELCELGPAVREPEYVDDAMAVARATMERVQCNIVMLREKLLFLGFEFAYPEAACVPAHEDAMRRFEVIEAEHGELSLSCRAWFERFHSVCFVQSPEQRHGEGRPSEVRNLGYNAALIVLSLEEGLDTLEEYRKGWQRDREAGATYEFTPGLFVGSCLSNNDIAGFGFGERGMDDPLYAADGRKDARFITELRRVIAVGGFPFWQMDRLDDSPGVPWLPGPNLERVLTILSADLVPF